MHWMLDETIDLTAICETLRDAPPPPGNQLPWVWAPIVQDLIDLDITPEDAVAFAYHVFSVHANGPGYDPARKLTEDQWDRLKYE
jgi:hypothetical protein